MRAWLLNPPLSPAALSVQSVATAVPPLSLVTFLISSSFGSRLFVNVQSIVSPTATSKVAVRVVRSTAKVASSSLSLQSMPVRA